MKKAKLLPMLGILIAGFVIPSLAQERTLPEVTVMARNYKYLKSVDNTEAPQPVKLLERMAAAYDVKNSEYYQDDNVNYFITFYLPYGYVLAVYDSSGTLLRTAEKFKDVGLPNAVTKAVAERYPNWSISNDIYLVRYNDASGTKKNYKLVLENGSKRLRVKIDDKGTFLD